MSFSIHWQRHFALFMVVLLLALGGLSFLASSLNEGSDEENKFEAIPNRSIFNRKQSGYYDWYQTVQIYQKAHPGQLPIRPWRSSFMHLANVSQTSTMVILEPAYSLTDPGKSNISTLGVKQLLTWVEQGNTLIYFDRLERPQAKELLGKIGLQKNKKRHKKESNKPIPSSSELKKQSVQILPDTPESKTLEKYITHKAFVQPKAFQGQQLNQFNPTNDTALPTPLLATDESPIVEKIRYGKGEVWIGTTPDLAQNRYLDETDWDNYQLFTNLLLAPGHPVYINEYVHNAAGQGEDLFSYYYNKTPIGRIGVQLGIIFLFLLWWSYAAWKPKQKPVLEADAPVSLGAFISSLGRLYQKAKATPLVLAPYWKALAQQLEKRCRMGLIPGLSPFDVDILLKRHLAGQSGLLRSLGYSESDAQKTIEILNNVYDVLYHTDPDGNAMLNAHNKPACSEAELLLWTQTMAELLQKLSKNHKYRSSAKAAQSIEA